MADDKVEEKERSDILIEGNVGTWEMSIQGDVQGTYIGAFRFKGFLTPTQQIAANRDYRELLGANPTMVPEHESFLAYALTQLKYRVVSAPPFWSAASGSGLEGDLPDENVISAVLDAALATEIKYRNQLKKKKNAAVVRAKAAAETAMAPDPADDEESDDENEE